MVVVDTAVMNDPSHVRKECLSRGILVILYLLLDTMEVSRMDDVFEVIGKRGFAHRGME